MHKAFRKVKRQKAVKSPISKEVVKGYTRQKDVKYNVKNSK